MNIHRSVQHATGVAMLAIVGAPFAGLPSAPIALAADA